MQGINIGSAFLTFDPGVAQIINDDILFRLGTSGDQVLLNRSTILATNTALTSVLIGTPVTQAIAADSLMISNVTASGDIAVYVNKGGHSQMVFWADSSTGDTAIMAASGASVDVFIAGTKILDYASGAFAFQQATTISTTATTLTLQPTTQLLVKCSADADDYFTFDVASNVPTIYGTGSYVRIGDAATAASVSTEDDLFVSGSSEFKNRVYLVESLQLKGDDQYISWGAGFDVVLLYETADTNARVLLGYIDPADSVPLLVWGDNTLLNVDLGLFDGVTQPGFAVIDKAGKYAGVANATSTGAAVTLTTATAGTFTNAVVGDTVRVTAGTNATAGWYVIDVVTDQYNINLDRNWCSGAVTGGTIVVYHSFTMLSSDGICTRTIDGTPDDTFTEIDKDGWILIDAIADTMWFRSGGAWKYISATGGLSMTKEERLDPSGHEFQIGDTVKLVVDKINENGSFHAIPIFCEED